MIRRYILVAPDGTEGDVEYDSRDEAMEYATRYGHAIVELQYELTDTELVWTPNGEDFWP